MREHADRQKVALNDLQATYKELQNGHSDTQAKFSRLKKDSREHSAESHALKDAFSKLDGDVSRYKQKVAEYEYELRNAKVELESSREDARKRRHDLFAAQDRIRHLQLELDVLKERDATRRAERRFRPENDSDVDKSWDSDVPIRLAL